MRMGDTTQDQFKQFNKQGFIPGAQETEEEFIQRAIFCLQLEETLMKQTDVYFPIESHSEPAHEALQEAYQVTDLLFDICPSWIPFFFSNYQLAAWHGGCAWIFQLNEKTPTAAFLQLRTRFKQQSTYLNLYTRKELIAHELSHVGRMMYQEPQFEEILAYQTSSSVWRRWIGPIFQSSKESFLFVLLLGGLLITDFATLSFDHTVTFPLFIGLNGLIAVFLLFLIGRLGWRQWIFHRCLNQLKALYQDSQVAHHLIYRLLDKEIRSFAWLTADKIKETIREKAKDSFRWHFILLNYPFRE